MLDGRGQDRASHLANVIVVRVRVESSLLRPIGVLASTHVERRPVCTKALTCCPSCTRVASAARIAGRSRSAYQKSL